jgi:hypothetical protein
MVKNRKSNKHHKLSKSDSTVSLGSSAATFNDEAPGVVSSPAAGIITIEKLYTQRGKLRLFLHFAIGEGCVDKFKNCHLVVQARLCKLKYYLVSCCASCSKPKT